MNTDKKITEQMLIDSLYEIVAENPDYVYGDQDAEGFCCYFDDEGEPSCLVGHVLARNGITAEQVEPVKVSCAPAVIREIAEIQLSLEAKILFDSVQCWQDMWEPWARALKLAEDEVKERTNA